MGTELMHLFLQKQSESQEWWRRSDAAHEQRCVSPPKPSRTQNASVLSYSNSYSAQRNAGREKEGMEGRGNERKRDWRRRKEERKRAIKEERGRGRASERRGMRSNTVGGGRKRGKRQEWHLQRSHQTKSEPNPIQSEDEKNLLHLH